MHCMWSGMMYVLATCLLQQKHHNHVCISTFSISPADRRNAGGGNKRTVNGAVHSDIYLVDPHKHCMTPTRTRTYRRINGTSVHSLITADDDVEGSGRYAVLDRLLQRTDGYDVIVSKPCISQTHTAIPAS